MNQPLTPRDAGIAALADVVQLEMGYRLFTVMALDASREINRRIWSSHPDLWPPGGEKPLPRTSELHRIVVALGQPRLVEGRDAIRAAFADHAAILAAGCESALNMPVRWRGRTVGALNLLHVAGHYAGKDLARLAALADGAAPLLLMQT